MNEICNLGIILFSFLIIGKGKMCGITFGDTIRKAYDCENNPKNKQMVEEIEKHIVSIQFDFNKMLHVEYR